MIKPSTLVELGGFGLLDWAAWHWGARPGLITTGLSLLLIGYATEDAAAVIAVGRMTAPLTRKRQAMKVRKAQRQARREKAREKRASRFRRQPAEIALTVKTD